MCRHQIIARAIYALPQVQQVKIFYAYKMQPHSLADLASAASAANPLPTYPPIGYGIPSMPQPVRGPSMPSTTQVLRTTPSISLLPRSSATFAPLVATIDNDNIQQAMLNLSLNQPADILQVLAERDQVMLNTVKDADIKGLLATMPARVAADVTTPVVNDNSLPVEPYPAASTADLRLLIAIARQIINYEPSKLRALRRDIWAYFASYTPGRGTSHIGEDFEGRQMVIALLDHREAPLVKVLAILAAFGHKIYQAADKDILLRRRSYTYSTVRDIDQLYLGTTEEEDAVQGFVRRRIPNLPGDLAPLYHLSFHNNMSEGYGQYTPQFKPVDLIWVGKYKMDNWLQVLRDIVNDPDAMDNYESYYVIMRYHLGLWLYGKALGAN